MLKQVLAYIGYKLHETRFQNRWNCALAAIELHTTVRPKPIVANLFWEK